MAINKKNAEILVAKKEESKSLVICAKIEQELSIAKDLITKLNGNIEQTESFSLPIEESTRNILKIKKIGATPSGYPRTYDKMQKELKKLQK